jgi:hypothetical protein
MERLARDNHHNKLGPVISCKEKSFLTLAKVYLKSFKSPNTISKNGYQSFFLLILPSSSGGSLMDLLAKES